MSNSSMIEGSNAFGRGEPRTANPYNADSEDWMCWRDGWEQAKAVADHVADGTAEACYRDVAAKQRRAETA